LQRFSSLPFLQWPARVNVSPPVTVLLLLLFFFPFPTTSGISSAPATLLSFSQGSPNPPPLTGSNSYLGLRRFLLFFFSTSAFHLLSETGNLPFAAQYRRAPPLRPPDCVLRLSCLCIWTPSLHSTRDSFQRRFPSLSCLLWSLVRPR